VYTVERLRKRRLRRAILWSLVGIVAAALAVGIGSYIWLYVVVNDSQITDSSFVSVIDSVPEDAIETPSGMNILLLGSDKRPTNSGEESRSDTVILVHVDPDEDYLSMLSFPRDLRVEVPGHGIQKLNYAYAADGPSLTVQTVEALTKVDIQEYMEVDFHAFSDITDSLGGVYLDIDRRYYNDDPDSGWEFIKISPGYQLLDGADALDFVRFRHDLNYDFGRMDRQQRFIAALREQAMGWNLPLRLPGLVSALFDNISTTLSTNDIIRLAAWGVRLNGDRIRQVTLVGDIQTIEGVSYVILPDGALGEAVDKLLTPPDASDQTASSGDSTDPTSDVVTTTTVEDRTDFITDPEDIPNSRLWKHYAAASSFTVKAPGYLPSGYGYVDKMPAEPGTYDIAVGDGAEPGIKMVYRLTREGEPTDQYMGIMQTAWLDAPAAGEGQEVLRDGITYTFVGTDQRIDRIWWKEGDVLYWVSNTLSYYLSKKEMLKVAESMIVVPGG